MAIGNDIHPFEKLEDYLEAMRGHYDGCLTHVEHAYKVDDVDVTLRLHHAKFNADGEPRFDALAKCLVEHITWYCISSCKRQGELTLQSANRLFVKARDYFRKVKDSGETGELLLYFLLETVLKAPQVVCKMELKTNPKDEVKGGDGIHVSWSQADDTLNIYLGESKLHQNYGGALDDAFASIKALHALGPKEHELNLVTSHFKFLAPEIRDRVAEYLDETNPVGKCKVKHACLIGYDWTQYKQLLTNERAAFIQEFEARYVKHVKALVTKTSELFVDYPHRHLSYEFFFLPFKHVQEFRNVFYEYLTGVRQ